MLKVSIVSTEIALSTLSRVSFANSGGADAEQRHFWNRCDGVHDGSKSAPISIPFFQLI